MSRRTHPPGTVLALLPVEIVQIDAPHLVGFRRHYYHAAWCTLHVHYSDQDRTCTLVGVVCSVDMHLSARKAAAAAAGCSPAASSSGRGAVRTQSVPSGWCLPSSTQVLHCCQTRRSKAAPAEALQQHTYLRLKALLGASQRASHHPSVEDDCIDVPLLGRNGV